MAQSKRILIAEDDPSVRRALRELVNRWGFSAAEAADGLQVCEILRDYQPDILLIDIDAPTLDAVTVLDEIRHRSLPVATVVISGESEIPKALKKAKLNPRNYIEKPVEPNVLKSLLIGICERRVIQEDRLSSEAGAEEPSVTQSPSAHDRAWTWPIFEVRVGTSLEEVEHALITRTIAAVKGNKTRAAAMLGISLRTLYNRLAHYRAGRKPNPS